MYVYVCMAVNYPAAGTGRKVLLCLYFVVTVLQQTLDHGVLDLSMVLQGQVSGQSVNNQRLGHFSVS